MRIDTLLDNEIADLIRKMLSLMTEFHGTRDDEFYKTADKLFPLIEAKKEQRRRYLE